MKPPLVSVIMPAYNAGRYVAEAIRSVIAQSHPNWELLIVNDGSADGTAQAIGQFFDPRIRYFEQENHGASAARNVGMANMEGDFFCFLDADDKLTPNSLSARVGQFEKSADLEFVDGSVAIYDRYFQNLQEVRSHSFTGNPLRALCQIDMNCFFGPSWMIKRMPNKKYKFDEGISHGEDLLFYISVSGTGCYMAVKDVTYLYREGHESAMSNIRGIGRGYDSVGKAISGLPHVNAKMLRDFKKKSKRIMLKSFLSKGYVMDTLKLLMK